MLGSSYACRRLMPNACAEGRKRRGHGQEESESKDFFSFSRTNNWRPRVPCKRFWTSRPRRSFCKSRRFHVRPRVGQPNHGRTRPSQPAHARAWAGWPAHGRAWSGWPAHARPWAGWLAHGRAWSGRPVHARARSGWPEHGRAWAGRPARARTRSGWPAHGRAWVGRPARARTCAGWPIHTIMTHVSFVGMRRHRRWQHACWPGVTGSP